MVNSPLRPAIFFFGGGVVLGGVPLDCHEVWFGLVWLDKNQRNKETTMAQAQFKNRGRRWLGHFLAAVETVEILYSWTNSVLYALCTLVDTPTTDYKNTKLG